MKNERAIVARIRELFPQDRAIVGIGDDAAIVGEQVATTDLLIEDVDFTRSTPVEFIARKSLAVNLSDLAAMGALPSFGLVALGLPPWIEPDLDRFLVSLADAARRFTFDLVGGDLSRSDKLIVSIAAFGHVQGRALLRSGAQRGDRIYLSRPIGASAAGLHLLQHGWTAGGEPQDASAPYALREFASAAIRRHLDPEPEIALGLELARLESTTSCIDVSDGLSSDLARLCEASGVGADIEKARLPIFPDLLAAGGKLGIHTVDAVLHGGEEYALLFTSTMRESELSSRLKRPVYAIGRMVDEPGVRLDGQVLEARGFDHFAT